MNARDIMSKDCSTVSIDTSIKQAATLMRDHDIGAVPVLGSDGRNRVMGFITDRDIVCRGLADGRSPDTEVGELMSRDVVQVSPEDDIEDVARRLEERKVRRVVVMEGEQLRGVIAQADLARHLDDARAGRLINSLSKPQQRARS